MSRNLTLKAVSVVMALGILAGCGGTKSTPAPTTPSEPTKPAAVAFKAGMVSDTGGLKDHSFNESAFNGLQKLKTELGDGAEIKGVESHRQEEYEPNMQTLIDAKFDIVWGIGFLMGDATGAQSQKNPKQKFGLIDSTPSVGGKAIDAPNVSSVLFKEEEGSFLMGVIAAKTTKTKKVGFVGGIDIPVIHHFEAGFKAGVLSVDPTVVVKTVYTGSFVDPALGKNTALAMINDGADVIFHAAGGTGDGVIEAAASKKVFAIGVDKDQNGLAPEYVISSMMKRVDQATYMVSKSVKEGNFKAGVVALGLKEDAVGYAPTTKWEKMPADTKALVDKYAAAIKAGTFVVPNEPALLKDFKAPKL
jgi:basic membrane protein A